MKDIKVLGSGCAKCTKTAEQLQKLAQEMNIEVTVSKQTDPQVIMEYGVMSTPAVVVDGQLVHSGSIPQTEQMKAWLTR
ncbi:thioredoxin family protein [uncultured Alteromonas sp.]|jgi:small redox-active disulfide protein 2|uniref:thioredoxin family protein n=1 Tax=uncultured Alteromonas sp. TaxID=179113 RepID=UPI0025FD5ADA|nr:thioredoxin family protein [uncultured Alteromonas sp.]